MKEQTGTQAGKMPLSRLSANKAFLAFILVSAALGFWWAVYNEAGYLRKCFLEDARMVSRAIDGNHVQGFTASAADLASPEYRRIKEQLAGIHRAAPRNHFVYLLRLRPDGVVVILADSEPQTSKEYSPPGQEYLEASVRIRQLFAGNGEATIGPYNDRWGRWVSALAPVSDPENGRTVALLGMDIDARDWYLDLALGTAKSLALVLLFIVPLAIYVMQRRHTLQDLRLSRDEWQNTFDCMPDLIAIMDTEHRIIRANKAMRDQFEQAGAPIIGQHCYRQVHNQDAPPDFCPHARLLKDGASHAAEAHLPELDGDYSVSVTPLHDTAGKLIGSIHIAHDITARKRTEKSLRENKDHYQALYRLIRLMCDNVPDLIWAKDMDQRYIFTNKAMCEILLNAEDTEEPIGKTDMYFAERERAAHPERSDWHTFGELCMDTDTAVMSARGVRQFDEFGNIKGKFLFLDVSKAPFWDEQGVMIGTVGCGRDVTAVKQLEQEHQRAEERLRRAEELGHLGHWTLDLRTNTQSWSDEMYRIYGVTPEEFQSTYEGVTQLVHPEDRETRTLAYATIRQEGKGALSYRVLRPDGQQRIISGFGELLYDADGEPEAVFGIILDITELHQKESELHQKNAEMERFTYTVSHDLRSPLVTIKTFLGYLEQDMTAGDTERVKQDVAYIHGAADKMRSLLDDLIEMSRIGRIVNEHTMFSFRELIEETLVIVAGQIAALGVDVTVQEHDLSLFGDRSRLVEVWQNLLDNAVKYMGDQQTPRIQIGVEERDGVSVFFVRDNGIGIAPQHTEKIFGLFEKLDNKSAGTGLGLTLVKRIVEMNGGRIWMESEGIGLGSCFRFTLPAAVTDTVGSRGH